MNVSEPRVRRDGPDAIAPEGAAKHEMPASANAASANAAPGAANAPSASVAPPASRAAGRIVMAHLVACYPTREIALAAADGLAAGGVSYFEIQFPFSDPSADGVAIQTACAETLARGWRLDDGFSFVSELRRRHPSVPAFVMTYANLAYRAGIGSFVDRAASAGAAGLIVPDLPFDRDEGLDAECRKRGLAAVPVSAPSMSESRLSSLSALGRPYVYAALRAGITGSATAIDAGTIAFLDAVSRGAGRTKILGGFGIREGRQAAELAPRVHAVVAGSVFVEIIRESAASGPDAVREAVAARARELVGA